MKHGLASGGQESVEPAGKRRRRDAQRARDGLQVFSAQQPQHRRSLALSVFLRRRPPFPARLNDRGLVFGCGVVIGSVHKFGYGHKFGGAASAPVVA